MHSHDQAPTNGKLPTGQDPKFAGLKHDQDEWLRIHAEREVIHDSKMDDRRDAHRKHKEHRDQQIDLTTKVELERLGKLRNERSLLEPEITAGEEVAAKALASLGIAYDPETSSPSDVYALTKLHESEAAERAGVGGVHSSALGGATFLKWAGMAGSFALTTIGLGAVVFQMPPKHLFLNPVALVPSMFFAGVIVAGTFMMIHPTWKRAGTITAGRDEEKKRKATLSAVLVSVVATVSVAVLDAKAVLAINAAKALVDPEHAMPLSVAVITGFCLSAVYVIGASVVAFNDAFAAEATRRIEAEQRKHEKAEMDDQRHFVEVRNAIEALNTVAVLRKRRSVLDAKITELQAEFKKAVDEHYEGIPEAPDMAEEHKADLRMHKKHAKFAEWKVQAHDAIRRLNPNQDGENS